jgi:hypothetical protein
MHRPVTPEDFADIANISSDSFAKDRHTIMKAHYACNATYNHEDVSREPLARCLRLPDKFQLIKAVENISSKIMGFVTWGFRGYTKANVPTLNGRGVSGKAGNPTGQKDIAVEAPQAKETLTEE